MENWREAVNQVAEASQALSGITVLDLTRILTGPYCTMMLGDFGAEVIKIEPPGGDDTRKWGPPFLAGESAYFLSVNRNKRSIALDLKSEGDRERFLQMVAQADVVVENYRPGTLERLRLDYAQLKAVNPRIILASISGFGQTGPGRNRPGYDVVAQAMSGLMSVTGDGEAPTKAGFAVGDIGAGMWAAFGIVAALWHRSETGEGQWLETSLWETLLAWQTYQAGNYFANGEVPRALGSAHPNIAPYQAVRAQDGYFVVACGNDQQWAKMAAACNIPFWEEPEFRTNADRVIHREMLIGRLEAEIFRTQEAACWVRILQEAGIPAAPILDFGGVYADPQVAARDMLITVDHPVAGTVKMPGIPLKMSQTPGAVVLPPPTLNQHHDEILKRFGLSDGARSLPEQVPTEPDPGKVRGQDACGDAPTDNPKQHAE